MQLRSRWCIRSKRVNSKLLNLPSGRAHPCSVELGLAWRGTIRKLPWPKRVLTINGNHSKELSYDVVVGSGSKKVLGGNEYRACQRGIEAVVASPWAIRPGLAKC